MKNLTSLLLLSIGLSVNAQIATIWNRQFRAECLSNWLWFNSKWLCFNSNGILFNSNGKFYNGKRKSLYSNGT